MTPAVIATIIGIPAATLALGVLIGLLERRYRHPQPSWDWPEDEWPSAGGWADREKL